MNNDQQRGTEPVFDGEIEKPFSLSRRAESHWDRLAPMLERSRVLQAGDVTALAMLCEELATWEQMNEAIARAGPVHLATGEDGKLLDSKVSALHRVRKASYENAMKGLANFGLTPADRSRVAGDINGNKPDNPFTKFGRK